MRFITLCVRIYVYIYIYQRPKCKCMYNTCIYFAIVPDEVGMVNVTRGAENGFPTLLISWNAVPSGGGALITYTVWYSTSSGTATEPPSEASTMSGITGTSTTLSGLTQGTRYFTWIAAVSSGGQGSYSTRVSEITFGSISYYSLYVFYMKNLRYHFPTCYAYSVKEPIGELNLKRALDENTGVFSSFFSLLSSSSPLGQTAISGNSTLHQ